MIEFLTAEGSCPIEIRRRLRSVCHDDGKNVSPARRRVHRFKISEKNMGIRPCSVSAKNSSDRHAASHVKVEKALFLMETLWENNLNLVKDAPKINANLITIAIIVSGKNKEVLFSYCLHVFYIANKSNSTKNSMMLCSHIHLMTLFFSTFYFHLVLILYVARNEEK
jgi:hypothetical protein